MKRISTRHIAKGLAWVLASPFLIFFILTVLLYLPPVQRAAVDYATQTASEATGMKVHIEALRLAFPFDLKVLGTSAVQEGDTVLRADQLHVDVAFWPLLSGRVDVEGVELKGTYLNTLDLVPSARIRGNLDRLFVSADSILLNSQQALVDRALIDGANLDILLADSVPEDTTESAPVQWLIGLDEIALQNSRVMLHMPGDSMSVAAALKEAKVKGTSLDLSGGAYRIRDIRIEADSIAYDQNFMPRVEGLDPNHIFLKDILVDIDSLSYVGSTLDVTINEARLKESCGIQLTTLQGSIHMDSLSAGCQNLLLKTLDSSLQGDATMDFSALSPQGQGRFDVNLLADLGKQDLMLFMGGMPEAFVRQYPNQPLVVRALVKGNMQKTAVKLLEAKLETAFKATAHGELRNLMAMDSIGADIELDAASENLGFLLALADASLSKTIRIPHLSLKGDVHAEGSQYEANLGLKAPHGGVTFNAKANTKSWVYDMRLAVEQLLVSDFMPKGGVGHLTSHAVAKGRGIDFLAPSTQAEARMVVDQLDYNPYDLSGLTLDANLQNGHAMVRLDSRSPLLDATAQLQGLLSKKLSEATFFFDLRKIDLYALKVTEKPLALSTCLHFDGATDLKDYFRLEGAMADTYVKTDTMLLHPKDITLDLLTNTDTTYVKMTAASLYLSAFAPSGYKKIMNDATKCSDLMVEQLKNKAIHMETVKNYLPELELTVQAGKDNPLYNIMLSQGYTFGDVDAVLRSSPVEGLNGQAQVLAFNTGSILLDTIAARLHQDVKGLHINTHVTNTRKNPTLSFHAAVDALLGNDFASLHSYYLDENMRKGLDVGVEASTTDTALYLHVIPEHPVVAYRTFSINGDNFMALHKKNRLEAKVNLVADDQTGLKIYSIPNPESDQDVTMSVHHFNVGELMHVIPYGPNLTGMLDGDFHFIMKDKEYTISGDAEMADVTYEKCSIGNLATQMVYLPTDDGGSLVNATLAHNGAEVATVNGQLTSDQTMDVLVELAKFPLNIANGFIPGGMAALNGSLGGELQISGTTDKPVVEGQLHAEEAHVLSDMYGFNLALDSEPIPIRNSELVFDKFKVRSLTDNPLVLDGRINFLDLNKISVNLGITANDFRLIDAKKTHESMLYGKVDIDLGTRITGLLDNLSVRGQMKVLRGTNVTYVLKDSPLMATDQLEGLVTFVDFADTLQRAETELVKPSSIDMSLGVSVDEAAQMHCLMSNDGTNYVNIEGGGDFLMQYTRQGMLTLTGRYTINSGQMHYTMPIIPLKNFTVHQGSYIEFLGNPMNPILNLAATENIKASVTNEDGTSRSVAFDVGVAITQTLDNLGLAFTLDAPNDPTISSQLASMGQEERGKLAVSMLATGMYLAENGGTKLTATSALNSFLQSQISTASGVFKGVDINLGMDQSTRSDGTSSTDYSFQFAKRFWGNRVSIIIGGKVSSGKNNATSQNEASFIDNVALEYRLDGGASRYVKLFYDRNKEDILEGRLTEAGAGLVMRKKVDNLSELFIFRQKKQKLIVPQADEHKHDHEHEQ